MTCCWRYGGAVNGRRLVRQSGVDERVTEPEPLLSAGALMVTLVVLISDVTTAPAGMPVPVIVSPTSAALKALPSR